MPAIAPRCPTVVPLGPFADQIGWKWLMIFVSLHDELPYVEISPRRAGPYVVITTKFEFPGVIPHLAPKQYPLPVYGILMRGWRI